MRGREGVGKGRVSVSELIRVFTLPLRKSIHVAMLVEENYGSKYIPWQKISHLLFNSVAAYYNIAVMMLNAHDTGP